MQILNSELLKSLRIYFMTLSKLGYLKYSEVDKLIVALFIGDILDGLFDFPIEEEDFKSMVSALNCIYGKSCLLPLPDLNRGVSIRYGLNSLAPRLTEQSEFRNTEIGELRSLE